MSEQPSPSDPSFEPYDAPAYGDVDPEPAPAQADPVAADPVAADPTLVVPLASPTPPTPPAAPAAASPFPPAPPGPSDPRAGGAGWSPYPVAPASASPYQLAPQYVGHLGAPTHPMATTSLVLGIVSIVALLLTPFLLVTFLGVVCAPFAIWLGVRSRREIRANPQAYSGEGLAMGGLITGVIGVVLGILALLAILAFVVFLAAVFSSA